MSLNDDDLSKTMVIPNPGGRRSNASIQQIPIGTQSVLDAEVSGTAVNSDFLVDEHAENLILAHAAELINLASNLRTLQPNNSTEQLRSDINTQIERFNLKLTGQGIANEIALTARYLICCLLDELVLSTPWGIESNWSRQTLLSQYHNETSGGEKFFVIINKIMEQPRRNIDLIELCYLCLSIGFRGKYKLSPTGESDVQQLCNMMYQALSLYRPAANELSPSWRVNSQQHKGIKTRFPLGLILLASLFVCAAFYIALLSSLHTQSSPLFNKIEEIAWDNRIPVKSSDPDSSLHRQYLTVKNDLEKQLTDAISEGLVEVILQNNTLILRFISEALFASGSVDVNALVLPERERLARVISRHTNAVVIVGHTDSTGRAESNWVISRQRAESIKTWLKQSNAVAFQMTTRGVADTQAISPDPRDSRNRRVEILIFVAGSE